MKPEIVDRILRYAGKERRRVSNPCMTAREAIYLADWIVANTAAQSLTSGFTALERFHECGGACEPSGIERLRFFCSLAMSGQDWLDLEPFIDAVCSEHEELKWRLEGLDK